MLDSPAHYYDAGLLCIPMRPGEKRPAVKWKHMVDLVKPFPRDLLAWWIDNPAYGVGVLLKPSGLLVIDCDSPAAVNEAIKSCIGPTPCNNTVITTHGAHFYYRLPAGCPPLRRVQLGASGKIDVLADGYVIAPPTIHPSGLRYEWHSQGPLQDAPAWAVERLTEIRARSIAQTHLAPEGVLEAFPNTPEETKRLSVAIKGVNPYLFDMLAGRSKVEDRSRAIWLCMNTLIRLRMHPVRPGDPMDRLNDESIAKVVWFGALGEKPRERGWQWLCDEIARARLELTPD